MVLGFGSLRFGRYMMFVFVRTSGDLLSTDESKAVVILAVAMSSFVERDRARGPARSHMPESSLSSVG